MKRTGIMVLGGLLVYGGLAGLAYGQGGTDVTVTVPNEKYAAFIVPEPGAKLKLTIQSGSQPLTSSKIMPEDTSDLALWSPGSHAGPGPHVYESGPVLSSREWLRISGNIAGNVGAGGGSGAKGFDVDVPAVDIDIEGVTEEKEEAEGGYVGVGTNGLRKVTISKVQAETRFRGKVKLTVVNGARIRLWEEPQRIHEITTFPKEYATPSALPKDIWVEGVTASASKGDVVLTASYTTPTENKTTQDKVKIAVINVESLLPDNIEREVDDGDGNPDTRTFVVNMTTNAGDLVTVTATPNPNIPEANLPSCWTLEVTEGTANGSGKLVRTIDRTQASKTVLRCTCGNQKITTVYVVHCTYSGFSDGAVPGHAWWVLGIEPSSAIQGALVPIDGSYANLINKDGGFFPIHTGQLHDDGWVRCPNGSGGHTPTGHHDWLINFAQLIRGLSDFKAWKLSPGTYDWDARNCVYGALRIGGDCAVSMPTFSYPDFFTPTQFANWLNAQP